MATVIGMCPFSLTGSVAVRAQSRSDAIARYRHHFSLGLAGAPHLIASAIAAGASVHRALGRLLAGQVLGQGLEVETQPRPVGVAELDRGQPTVLRHRVDGAPVNAQIARRLGRVQQRRRRGVPLIQHLGDPLEDPLGDAIGEPVGQEIETIAHSGSSSNGVGSKSRAAFASSSGVAREPCPVTRL